MDDTEENPNGEITRPAGQAFETVADIPPGSDVCWYCRRAPGEAGASKSMELHQVIMHNRGGSGPVTWRSQTITVPRCGWCKRVHTALLAAGVLLALVAPVYMFVFASRALGLNPAETVSDLRFIRLLGLCAAAFALQLWLFQWPGRAGARFLGTRLEPESEHLTELQRAGWNKGSRPTSAM